MARRGALTQAGLWLVVAPAGAAAIPRIAGEHGRIGFATAPEIALVAAIGAGILLTGFAITAAILREHLPGVRRPEDGPSVTSPPQDLRPALAGALLAGDAKLVHAIACLLDLAARGHLQFEPTDPDHPLSASAWSVRRLRTNPELEPWEHLVLEAVSDRPGEAIPAPAALRALRSRLGAFRVALRHALATRGDVDPAAGERRRPLHVVSAIAILLAIGGFAVAVLLLGSLGPVVFAPAVALVVVSLVALAAASGIPRHSPQGWRSALEWRAFAHFLRSRTRAEHPMDAPFFARWLAYAFALGLGPAWWSAGKRAQLAAPSWFGGSKSRPAPLAALEVQLVAAGAIPSQSSSSKAGVVGG